MLPLDRAEALPVLSALLRRLRAAPGDRRQRALRSLPSGGASGSCSRAPLRSARICAGATQGGTLRRAARHASTRRFAPFIAVGAPARSRKIRYRVGRSATWRGAPVRDEINCARRGPERALLSEHRLQSPPTDQLAQANALRPTHSPLRSESADPIEELSLFIKSFRTSLEAG